MSNMDNNDNDDAEPESRPYLLRRVSSKAARYHKRVPGIRKLPLPAAGIILALVTVNVVVWAAVGIVLVCDERACPHEILSRPRPARYLRKKQLLMIGEPVKAFQSVPRPPPPFSIYYAFLWSLQYFV